MPDVRRLDLGRGRTCGLSAVLSQPHGGVNRPHRPPGIPPVGSGRIMRVRTFGGDWWRAGLPYADMRIEFPQRGLAAAGRS